MATKKSKTKSGFSSGKYAIRPAPMPRLDKPVTTEQRKKLAAEDKRKIASALGPDWQSKVFGDVGRYKKATANVRGQNKKISGIRKEESSLEAQKGTPGAVDQALQNRISELERQESTIKAKGGGARATIRADKKRFQRAAKKASVSDNLSVRQKRARKLGQQLGGKFDSRMNLPIYRNPNSSAKQKQRKKAVQKYVRKYT